MSKRGKQTVSDGASNGNAEDTNDTSDGSDGFPLESAVVDDHIIEMHHLFEEERDEKEGSEGQERQDGQEKENTELTQGLVQESVHYEVIKTLHEGKTYMVQDQEGNPLVLKRITEGLKDQALESRIGKYIQKGFKSTQGFIVHKSDEYNALVLVRNHFSGKNLEEELTARNSVYSENEALEMLSDLTADLHMNHVGFSEVH